MKILKVGNLVRVTDCPIKNARGEIIEIRDNGKAAVRVFGTGGCIWSTPMKNLTMITEK